MAHIYLSKAILRLGGHAFSDFPVATGSSKSAFDEIIGYRNEAKRLSDQLIAPLEAVLPVAYDRDGKLGRIALNLKRNTYNMRPVSDEDIAAIKPLLVDAVAEQLIGYAKCLQSLLSAQQGFAQIHANEVETTLQQAIKVEPDAAVMRAIRTINAPLAANAASLSAKPDSILADRQSTQIASSFFRYVLRAAYKTSPLSSLGSAGFVDVKSPGTEDDALPVDLGGKTKRVLQVRLKFLEHAIVRLTPDMALLSPTANVRLNPSLSIKESKLHWRFIWPHINEVAAITGTQGGKASSDAAFLKLLWNLIGPGNQKSIAELIEAINERAPQLATRVDALLQSAWESSFIQLAIPAGLDSIDRLGHVISVQSKERAEKLAPLFAEFVAATCAATEPDELSNALKPLLLAADSLPAATVKTMVIEDYIIDDPGSALPQWAFPGPLDAWEILVRLVPILTNTEPMRLVERWVTTDFVQRFGEGGTCSNAADFLFDAAEKYDQLLTEGMEKGLAAQELFAFIGVTPDPALKPALEQFFQLVEAAGDGPVAQLDMRAVRKMVDALPAASTPARLSKLLFYQPVQTAAGDINYVLNAIYPGFLSSISRFIPPDGPVYEACRDYLQRISSPAQPTELLGHFGFNANVHTVVSDHTLGLEPFTSTLPDGIALTGVEIRHDAKANMLRTFDANGQEVDILYLGVMQPFFLPTIYMLLQTLPQSVVRVPRLPQLLIERKQPDSRKIIDAPRVTMGPVILSRRSIAVAKSTLPDVRMPEADFFCAFNEWADAVGLWQRSYYYFTELSSLHDSPRSVDQSTVNMHKPMPLDRGSPAMLRAFQKDAKTGEHDIVFSEALPDFGESCFAVDGKPTVAEVAIDLTVGARQPC